MGFVQQLIDGDYEAANKQLARDCEESLQKGYQEMVAYGDSPVNFVEVMETLEEWPDKQDNDLVWIYVVIACDGFFRGSHIDTLYRK